MKKVLLIAVSAIFLCGGTVVAETSAEAKAKAALALVAASRSRDAKAKKDCGCHPGDPCECGAKCICSSRVSATIPINPIEVFSYSVAYATAVKQNKPLLIWVGVTCPSCESKWTSYIHARCTEFEQKGQIIHGPCVLVAKPDGLGGMDLLGNLPAIPTLDQVQALLTPVIMKQTYVPSSDVMLGGCAGGS